MVLYIYSDLCLLLFISCLHSISKYRSTLKNAIEQNVPHLRWFLTTEQESMQRKGWKANRRQHGKGCRRQREPERLSWWHRASGSLGHERKTAVCHLMWHFTLTLNEMSRSINDPILASWNEGDQSLPTIALLHPSHFPPSLLFSHIKAYTSTSPCLV